MKQTIYMITANKTNQYGIPLPSETKVFANCESALSQQNEWINEQENGHLKGNSVTFTAHTLEDWEKNLVHESYRPTRAGVIPKL